MASITQIIKAGITPKVAEFLKTPVPGLPPPPPGLGYEVKVTPAGDPYRTGNLIPTRRTTTGVFDDPAFKQFLGLGGLVAGLAGGEALSALPSVISEVAPGIVQTIQGGLPPWVSSTLSSIPGRLSSIQRLAGLKTFLAGARRPRSRTSARSAVVAFQPGMVFYPNQARPQSRRSTRTPNWLL